MSAGLERNYLQISCQRTVAGTQFDKGVNLCPEKYPAIII